MRYDIKVQEKHKKQVYQIVSLIALSSYERSGEPVHMHRLTRVLLVYIKKTQIKM